MRAAWLALVLFVASAVVAQAYSTGPPSSVATNDGCTCHSSNPNAGTVVSVAHPGSYLGAARHTIRVTSTTDVAQNPAGNKGGFLAWASHGSFEKSEGSQDWYVLDSLDGRPIIKHNLDGDRQNAAQEWRFDWLPPQQDVGAVQLKVWVNRVNGDGQASGLDHWNRKHVSIPAEPHKDPAPSTTASMATTTASSPRSSAASSPSAPQGTQSSAAEPGLPALAAVGAAVVGAMLVGYRRR